MRKINIKASKQKPERGALPVWSILFFLAGIFGLLFFLSDIDGIAFSKPAVFAFATAIALVLRLCDYYNRKLFWTVFFAAVLCCAYAAFRLRAVLWTQLQQFAACFTSQSAAQVTLLMTLGVAVLTLLFYLIEYVLHGHFWLWLITTALLLAAPFVNIRFRTATVLLLLVFQTSFWALHTVRAHRCAGTQKRKAAWKNGLLAGLLAALLFAICAPLTARFSKPLYQAAFAAEGFVTNTVQNISGSVSDTITDGTIGRGNNYGGDTPRLELTAFAEPPESFYLRGFFGKDYLGGEWEEEQWVPERYSGGVYSLTIQRLKKNDDKIYAPYDSSLRKDSDDGRLEFKYLPSSPFEGAVPDVYPHTNGTEGYILRTEWNKPPEEITNSNDNPSDRTFDPDKIDTDNCFLPAVYIDETEYTRLVEAYTQVPEVLLPRLTALAKATPLTQYDEISAFVFYTLHSNTTYSLTPGWAPMNTDIVESFLFERKTGYCNHFASTAVLLYRLYGIPARYVSGYCVSQSAFSKNKDTSGANCWTAVATEEDAHAWVEIYLPQTGWIPVEVTAAPSAAGGWLHKGLTYERFQEILDEHGWDMSKPSLVKAAQNNRTVLQTTATAQRFGEVGAQLLTIIACCLLACAILLPLLAQLRRLRRKQRFLQMRSRQIFTRLLQLLHECNLLTDCDGTEADFALRLTAVLPILTEQETTELMAQVNRAAYGEAKDAPNDGAILARGLYRRAYAALYALQPRRKRLSLKFIKAFG